jgi:Flp pilus assembly protein TadG
MLRMYKKHEEGQSLVLIALAMVALVAIVGLVVDGGRVYAARRQSQNASDAGAFAGASVLATRTGSGPSDDAKIRDAVRAYALDNGIAATSDITAYYMNHATQLSQVGTGTVPSNATGIRVYTTINIPTFLIGVVSRGHLASTKTFATAQTGLLQKVTKVMPVTIKDQAFTYGQPYQLQGQDTGPGNFQWLDFTKIGDSKCSSPNEQELADRLNPYDNTPVTLDLSSDTWICGAPGEKVGKDVRNSLDSWLANFSDADRIWIVPIYDTTTGQGQNFNYHIIKFAAFEFSGYDFGGNKTGGDSCTNTGNGGKCVVGKFLKYVKLGSIDESEDCNTNGDDVCGAQLTE